MLGFLLGLAALFPNTVFESVYSIPKTEGKTPPVFFSGCRKSQRLFRQPAKGRRSDVPFFCALRHRAYNMFGTFGTRKCGTLYEKVDFFA